MKRRKLLNVHRKFIIFKTYSVARWRSMNLRLTGHVHNIFFWVSSYSFDLTWLSLVFTWFVVLNINQVWKIFFIFFFGEKELCLQEIEKKYIFDYQKLNGFPWESNFRGVLCCVYAKCFLPLFLRRKKKSFINIERMKKKKQDQERSVKNRFRIVKKKREKKEKIDEIGKKNV